MHSIIPRMQQSEVDDVLGDASTTTTATTTTTPATTTTPTTTTTTTIVLDILRTTAVRSTDIKIILCSKFRGKKMCRFKLKDG